MGTTTTAGLAKKKIEILNKGVTVGALVFWAIVLYYLLPFTEPMSRTQYGIVFLGGILCLYVLNEAIGASEEGDYLDLLILSASAFVMVAASVYLFTNFTEVYTVRQGRALDHEYRLAWLVIAVILYLTWRSFGNVFLALVGAAMLYGVYGQYVPGIFSHGGVPTTVMLQVLVTDMAGFYGSLTQLTAAWIAPFLLYAGLLFAYGAFDLILRVAIVAGRYIESGVAQTAVLASAVIGSINGSYAANAGMTGSFTIPTMMDAGLKDRTAAGIEGVASTSGQVLPPVMGASAFVMASFLGIAYVDIIIAGLLPAAILVASIVVAVHYTSIREIDSTTMRFEDFFDEEMTSTEKVVEGIRFGVPFAVLIITLGIFQWTVMTSALYTIVAMITLGVTTPVVQKIYVISKGREPWHVELDEKWSRGFLRPKLAGVRSVHPIDTFIGEVSNTVGGFRRGAIILAPIAIILAAVNGIVDLLMITGIPSRIALLLMELSGGVLIVAVVLGMGVCIVMGIGMPTVAAYVIVSTLVAPTFINVFEVPELAAHFMVFYAAVMAGVTPPVAVAVVVAAGIAGANFWRACATAIKIAAPLFILPISFIYHPEIVSTVITPSSLLTAGLILLGAITMIYGINYPFRIRRRFGYPLRFGLLSLGVFVMVYPERMLQVAGAVVFALVFVGEKAVSNGHSIPLVSSSEPGD